MNSSPSAVPSSPIVVSQLSKEPARGANGRSFLALIGGAVAIGFAPIFVRWSEVGPSATAFWRLVLATPVLWAWFAVAARQGAASPRMTGGNALSLLAVGLFFAGDMSFWNWSVKFISVANSTLLANLAPIYVVLFGWLAWRRRVSGQFLLAMLAALAGAALLLGGDFGSLHPRALLGEASGLIAAGFYAGYLILVGELRQRFSTAAIMAWSGLVSAAALGLAARASGEIMLPRSARGWWVLLALGLLSHAVGQGLIAFALARLPTALVSVGLLVQPVTAALAGATLLQPRERIGWPQAVGMAMVLAGIFVARRETNARRDDK